VLDFKALNSRLEEVEVEIEPALNAFEVFDALFKLFNV